MKELFELEHFETQQEVRKHIQDCEGVHTQQAIYSIINNLSGNKLI